MTNLIRILTIVFLVTPSLTFALDQSMPTRMVVTDELSQGLSDLRTSVDQMSVSNEALAAKNDQMKGRLNSAQVMLQKLNQDNQELNAAKLRAETPNPSQVKKVEDLQKVSSDLDGKINGLKEEIRMTQERIASAQKEDEEVNEKINQIQNPSAIPDEESLTPELAEIHQQKQKQKLAALKIISESQAHQMLLQEQLLDAQKNILPSEESQQVARKNMLEAEIARLEKENAQLNELLESSSGQALGPDQMRELERSVSDLERNRKELSDLVGKMQKKAQKIHLSNEDRNEQAKLQYNVDQLKTEAKSLRLDLEESEQQMVELDKRKSQLELLLRK